jgi:hypothetical protein
VGRRLFHAPRHYLSIYAIFQNEAHIIREWMDLHWREGIEHFFLLDHGSTDDWRDRIAAHVAAGRVTVRSLASGAGGLDQLRVEHAEFALRDSEWVVLQDLDEFTYANGTTSIAGWLKALPADVHQVVVPWICFGTGGNLRQPDQVVKECRRSEDMAARPRLSDQERPWHVKSIFRARYLRRMHTHVHDVSGRTVLPVDALTAVSSRFYIANALAHDVAAFRILQNHYVHQSLDFYRAKMQRRGYWLETRRGVKSYTEERFEREEPLLNAVPNDTLFERHRAYYEAHGSARALPDAAA